MSYGSLRIAGVLEAGSNINSGSSCEKREDRSSFLPVIHYATVARFDPRLNGTCIMINFWKELIIWNNCFSLSLSLTFRFSDYYYYYFPPRSVPSSQDHRGFRLSDQWKEKSRRLIKKKRGRLFLFDNNKVAILWSNVEKVGKRVLWHME